MSTEFDVLAPPDTALSVADTVAGAGAYAHIAVTQQDWRHRVAAGH